MANKRDPRFIVTTLAVLLMHGSAVSEELGRFEALSGLPFSENRPTQETARTLRDELLFQRATQAYLWALPLINTLGMKVGSEKAFGAGYNVLPVWKKRLDAKTLVTTPNSDVIYAMGYVDLGNDGPLVFEAPPNLQGILLDAWQRPIPVDGGRFFGDVGLPGPDAGQGGEVSAPAPRVRGTGAGGLFCLPFGDQERVRLPAGVLPGPEKPGSRRRAHRTGEDLSAQRRANCQTDAVSRCVGCAGQHAADQ